MSRDAKRTWSKQAEEIDNGHLDLSEKMEPNSRENSNSSKKSKPNTDSKQGKPKKTVELETDPEVLQRRQKQIDYGKNTVGYANFTQQIPVDKRTKEHPKTPDKYTKYSRRGWDMLIKIWRKKLHEFDTNEKECSDDGGDNADVNSNNDVACVVDDDEEGNDDIGGASIGNDILDDMDDVGDNDPTHSEESVNKVF